VVKQNRWNLKKNSTILLLTTGALFFVPTFYGATKAPAPTQTPAPKPQPIVTLDCEEEHHVAQKNWVLLNADGPSQQLYLLHNTSDKTLLLSHYQPDPGANAGWASELKPGHWSVLAMDKEKFALSCQKIDASGEFLNCNRVLNICDMPEASFPRLTLGAYWVTENQKFSGLVTEIRKIGIQIPDSPKQIRSPDGPRD
jgi:hypothetical protein